MGNLGENSETLLLNFLFFTGDRIEIFHQKVFFDTKEDLFIALDTFLRLF